jgi:phytoene dehydrogenase-like protein
MKFYTSAIALASCLASASAAATAKCIDVDVAVIGGGSSGIHAAINLKDAGAKVVVIEKKDQIGGHAETYVNPKNKVLANIGVVIFENIQSVQKYFTRLEVPYVNRNPIAASGPSKQYDFTLGIPIPAQSKEQAAATQQATAAAMKTYAETVLPKYGWVDQGFLIPDPLRREL